MDKFTGKEQKSPYIHVMQRKIMREKDPTLCFESTGQ